MSYDEDGVSASSGFGLGGDDDAADDELMEPLEGVEDFGLDEEDPDHDH